METKIATNIDTDVFYAVINFLKENGWKLTAEYDEKLFDKGVDFDFYRFEKDSEMVLMAWNNWFEGEIKASAKTLDEIAKHFKLILTFGAPEYLHDPDLISTMKGLIKIKKGTNWFRS
ncbi:hypothetical protein [Pedobacter miscanthi]|uniref:Uncharacterized protein n=1 Tax=Pedobacter miscanthi TaxID=2259170 RepID=A0A366KQ04_9SPHI|nr:hypothetical protein [Pedobacter miscanthi]RBQ03363.1 hypothetical protein DRW42_21475 [Pedobacter miscanthi]